MQTAKLVLEYLRVFLSVQMVCGAAVVTFLLLFRKPIRDYIDRIANVAFGGTQIATPQKDKAVAAANELETNPKPPVQTDKEVKLPEGFHLSPEDAQKVRDLIVAERATARLWEYRYLGHYLAHSTQVILDDLVSRKQRTTVELLDARLQPFITDAEERRAIINALQKHYLIMVTGNLIEVTEKGREYVAWRGPATQIAA